MFLYTKWGYPVAYKPNVIQKNWGYFWIQKPKVSQNQVSNIKHIARKIKLVDDTLLYDTTSTCKKKKQEMVALCCKKIWNPRTGLNHHHQGPGFLGCYLDYFHTISQEIKNWFRPNGHYASVMGRGGRCRSQMTDLLTWLPSWIFMVKANQLSLPHFIGEHLMQRVGCICGARMTCPTHLHEWYLFTHIFIQ